MIRKATLQDIPAIEELLQPEVALGRVLPRAPEDVEVHLREFFVDEQDGRVVATAGLVCGSNGMTEVRSLVVRPEYRLHGIGRALVQACIAEALQLGHSKIFVLTYVTPFFEKLGYQVIDKSQLPDKIWKDCQGCRKRDNCDEVAMIRDLVRVTMQNLPQALRSGGSDPAVTL